MEEQVQPKKRGRPAKVKTESKVDFINSVKSMDAEEKAQHNIVVDEWYEKHGDKIVRKLKKAGGTTYSFFHCSVKKGKNKIEVERLKASGLLK